jgi:hypothetical protein
LELNEFSLGTLLVIHLWPTMLLTSCLVIDPWTYTISVRCTVSNTPSIILTDNRYQKMILLEE